MRVLITGHDGYIGSVLTPMAREAGYEVRGLDARLFQGCSFGPAPEDLSSDRIDVRDVEIGNLKGCDAIVHLAAISNDPLGDLDPSRTYEINHLASVRLARLAKRAGVKRFVFASSCSLYGAASPDDLLTELAPFNPVTPYGKSKVLVERDLSRMANDDFSPTFMRNATVYGYSPRLRLDLVVNDLAASAFTTGEVMVKSDGTPWRPLVHVEDAALAFLAALDASRQTIHNEAFNIGRSQENFQVRDVAEIVGELVPLSRVSYAPGGSPDPRSYRVDFSKAESKLAGFRPRWTLRDGVRQLVEAYRTYDLSRDDLSSSRFVRLRRIQALLDEKKIAPDLRWLPVSEATSAFG